MISQNGKDLFKTLIIQDEQTSKIKIEKVRYKSNDEYILVLPFVQDMYSDLSLIQVVIYSFVADCYVPINQEFHYPLTFLNKNAPQIALIKVRANNYESDRTGKSQGNLNRQMISQKSKQKNQSQLSETSSMRKQRSRQRVIFEVIQIVKRWRQLHQGKQNIKKVSLQQAAKIVGLPKKSLDDYYYQLRLGQKYQFDFKAHLFDRIGVLRTYLKNLKDQSLLDKTEKHPKNLKIIQQFDDIADIFNRQKQQGQNQKIQQEQEFIQDESDMLKIQDLNNSPIVNVNNYNQFEYMLNEKDPFMSGDFNFKKKGGLQDISDDPFF